MSGIDPHADTLLVEWSDLAGPVRLRRRVDARIVIARTVGSGRLPRDANSNIAWISAALAGCLVLIAAAGVVALFVIRGQWHIPPARAPMATPQPVPTATSP